MKSESDALKNTEGRTDGPPAAHSGTFRIGRDLSVRRLGFGAMRLTGEGIWGEPRDHDEAIRVLRRAIELGVTFIDTADAYGPHVSERLIAEALHPYPPDVAIATKGGFDRPGPNQWTENGRPEHLRAACEGSLRRLRVDRIDLYQLHRIDPKVPVDEQLATLGALQTEGKIRHVGLSEVTVAQIERARTIVPIETVQNRYSLADREHEDVLDYCEREGIGFIPWYPLAAGELIAPGSPLNRLAASLGLTTAQLALAWLLWRSPVMLPIPGTSRVRHLEENIAAASVILDERQLRELAADATRTVARQNAH
jgi:aryl-alcohol dehydrogenase-like predicted oxidoreductase